MDAMSPGWASVRVLAWLSAAGAATAAALMWLNANAFRAVLGEMAARRMLAGALATSAAALALLVVAIAHYSTGRRGSRVGGALFALAALGSLALPLAARGPAGRDPADRVAAAAAHDVRRSAPTSHDVVARRGIARIHPHAIGRRTAAELLQTARVRCLDVPGDRPPDSTRTRLGGGRHRHVSREERRPIGSALLRARGYAADVSAAGSLLLARVGALWRHSSRRELLLRLGGAAAVEHPVWRRSVNGGGSLAADVSRPAHVGIRPH